MESYSLIFRTGETLLNQLKILKGCCLLADQSSDLERNKKSLDVPFQVVDDLILNRVEPNDNDENLIFLLFWLSSLNNSFLF